MSSDSPKRAAGRCWAAATCVVLLVPAMADAEGGMTLRGAHRLVTAWQMESALRAGERLLLERPDDPRVWVLAARVQHQRGEHLSALALLEAAQREGAHAEELGEVAARVSSSAAYAAHFDTLETAHFKIRYLNKDEIVATYAGPVLESAYQNVGRELKILPAEQGEKIVVEIFPDARGLAGATGLTIQEIETSGTIAVCKFHRIMIISPLATANGYAWADTLAHEYVHLVISKKSHNTIPIWLHEGIAKFYESLWHGELGGALTAYSEKLLREAVRNNEFITFAQMHPSMAKLPSQDDAGLAFAEVFTVIEFLNKRYGKDTVPKLLDLSAGGMSVEAALKRVYGLGLQGIEKRWKSYLRKRKFRQVAGARPQRIQLATDPNGGDQPRPLEKIEEKEVHDFARLGELLELRGNHAAAVLEYEKAHARAGARYATLVNRLARAYAATDRHGEALKVLDGMLRVHPGDGDGHLMAGRLRLRRAEEAEARKHFESARLQNPFNPEVHLALQKLYEKAGDEAEAAKERRLLALSRKARPTRVYERPPPRSGDARVSVVTGRWGPALLDGGVVQITTPAWEVPVAGGPHTVEYVTADGSTATHAFEVEPGSTKLVVLKD